MVALSRWLVVVLAMLFVVVLANTLQAQTRSDGSGQASGTLQDALRPATTPIGALSSAPPGGVPQGVVPYVSVAERYDDNILFTPTNKQQDFVTNIAAGARMSYRNDMVDTTLRGGLTSEVYARNPGLNYVGTNASLNAVLDKAVGRVVRGLGLSISDTVIYTPKPQAWLTPEVTESSFISGIQAYRNNTLTNVTNLLSTYALTPSDLIKASYSYQMLRFYNTQGAVTGAVGGLFNTDVHIFLAGLDHQINPSNTIGGSYQHQQMSFQLNTGGPSSGVVVDGAMATWKSLITREWTATVSPGISLLSSVPGAPQWTMLASLEWRTPMITTVTSYTRSILPAFFQTGSAMITDSVALSIFHSLTSQWSVGAQGNYARSSTLGAESGNLQFDSYGGRSFVNYVFYPGLIASGTLTWDRFTFGAANSVNQVVSRQTAVLSLTAEWN
jgi:hypothetical protein